MENLHLIVGLGNPGAKYAQTRHNIGFQLVERLAEKWRAVWNAEKKFQASVARVARNDSQVILARPQTFMNASGEAVQALAGFYRVPPGKILVAVDDADLPLGGIRLRASGSSGGHHGLESIEQHLGTREFARLRIGIGRKDSVRQITNHVLGKFEASEQELLDKVLSRAAGQVDCWLAEGLPKAMSLYNGKIEA